MDELIRHRREKRLRRVTRHVEIELVFSAWEPQQLVPVEDPGECRCLRQQPKGAEAPGAPERHAQVKQELRQPGDESTLFHRNTT
ncbi:hypothetical protein SDC9_189217 [bioreactor metagenome]|uniref:Uncharacterized protein n=1 Tax=bioreactor metagenome TaxID=1076179 RepID=A0A645I2E7_9ZZZZ